jgi:hypothetical protein
MALDAERTLRMAGALGMVAVALMTRDALAQERPLRTLTLEDCDKPLQLPNAAASGKCPVAPGDLDPEALRLELAPEKPLPPALTGQPANVSGDAQHAGATAADATQTIPAADGLASASAPVLDGPGMFGAIGTSMPRLSVIGLMSGAWYSRARRPALGSVNADQDGLNLQVVELAFESTVDSYLRAAVFLRADRENIAIEEAYAATLALAGGFEVKAGKYRTSLGRINEAHAHAWHFVDAPVVLARFLGGEGLKPVGVQLNWLAPLPFHLKLVGNVHNAETVGGVGPVAGGREPFGTSAADRAREAATALTFGTDGRLDMLYVGRVETFVPFNDEWSLHLGGSGALGPSGQGTTQKAEVWGGDLYLRYKPAAGEGFFEVKWQSEAMLRRRQLPGTLLQDWGCYSELAIRLAERWYVAVRGDFVDGEAVVGHDLTGPGKNRRELKGSASLYVAPSDFSVVRLQYALDNPYWLGEKQVHAIFLQLGFSLGPHGAHPF